jgi:hypothetical protein
MVEINDFQNIPPICSKLLFNSKVKLLPSVTEVFELKLAYLEYNVLAQKQHLNRLAYFKSINGDFTKHFLMYNHSVDPITLDRSAITKTYFRKGLFSTGYATHSLFPYRGKFHPQLIKALLNIMNIKEGETILDPMCGSGTTNIEASLLGINSYAIDLSPFCQFMTKVKYKSLTINLNILKGVSLKANNFFKFFNVSHPQRQLEKIEDTEKLKVYELVLLAFLDSLGYSKRVKVEHEKLFPKVLKRYEDTVSNFLIKGSKYVNNLGTIQILTSANIKNLSLKNDSIDGIITSPPYSFAIDYVKNDEAQLNCLGYDVDKIRGEMIGLIGKNKKELLNRYFEDMDKVCFEMFRVLKENKYFVMIIGSNTNQTGGIRLERSIIESCKKYGLKLVKTILKPIKGIRNTMKDEFI